jgi:hypothetical protein
MAHMRGGFVQFEGRCLILWNSVAARVCVRQYYGRIRAASRKGLLPQSKRLRWIASDALLRPPDPLTV